MRRAAPSPAAIGAARTFLFTPALELDRLAKAREGDADALIADLEDAIAPAEKAAARDGLAAFLAETGPRVGGVQLVRVNDPLSEDGRADVAAVAGLPVDGLVVPKATVAALWAAGTKVPLIPLVESAAGVRDAGLLASTRGVARLMLGTIDLARELGLRPLPGGAELLHARSRLVVESAAAGIAAPIDGVVADVEDLDAVGREAELARGLGFGAKACIHPRQLAPVRDAFRPSEGELEWARRISDGYRAALDRGQGVAVVEGEMVDVAVARHAERILEES